MRPTRFWMGLFLCLVTVIHCGTLFAPADFRVQAAAQGNIYYVAMNGDDANPGTLDQPWHTIQKAANSLAAGDTVYIRAGTYAERVQPQSSGSAGNLITYAAYPGETAILDGTDITLPDDLAGLFEITSRSYIRVVGLRVVNAGPNGNNAGIMVMDSGYITIENNNTYNTHSSGIGIWGSHHVAVAGNRIDEAGGSGMQECLTVAGTNAFEVHHNEVLNCHKEGIDAKDGASNGKIYHNEVYFTRSVGIYVDAWDKHTYNIEVYQNVVHDIVNNDGFALASEMGGLLENIHVYNNLAYHNRYVGLTIASYGPGGAAGHPMKDIYVVNNTFYNNGWETWGGGIALDNVNGENLVIRNNILSQNLTFQLTLDPGVPTQTCTLDHNLIDGFRGTEGEIYGTDAVTGEARFMDAPVANLRLQADSPAIDAGAASGAPAADFDGLPRPLDGDGDSLALVDLGAFERPFYSEHVYLPLILK